MGQARTGGWAAHCARRDSLGLEDKAKDQNQREKVDDFGDDINDINAVLAMN